MAPTVRRDRHDGGPGGGVAREGRREAVRRCRPGGNSCKRSGRDQEALGKETAILAEILRQNEQAGTPLERLFDIVLSAAARVTEAPGAALWNSRRKPAGPQTAWVNCGIT